MNKLKNTIAIILFFAAFLFSACETESIDQNIIDNYNCLEPTEFASSDFVASSVALTWVAGSDEEYWQVEYGFTGFSHSAGTLIDAFTNSLTIEDLNPTKQYEFYVRAMCGEMATSEWVGPITVGTDVIPTEPTESFFKVDFNAATYNATVTTAFISSNNILISGARGVAGENIGIVLDGTTVKTYDGAQATIVYNPSNTSEFDYANMNNTLMPNGAVVITEIDQVAHTISGTFKFTGYWTDYTDDTPPPSIIFTNGSFTIPYTETNPSTDDTFFARIDGVEFADELIATAVAGDGTNDTITINATNAAQNQLILAIKDSAPVGTYNVSTDPFNFQVSAGYRMGTNNYVASSGTITIVTKTDTRISGTFQFTLTNGQVITEGAFDVEY